MTSSTSPSELPKLSPSNCPKIEVDNFSDKMARLFQGRFRFSILLVATGCLSMMLANILCLNFTILCMTEEKFRWENITIDLGPDVFEKVDFEASTTATASPSELDVPKFSDIQMPSLTASTSSFNWQRLKLARQNPQLFLRLLKMVAIEAVELAAKKAGEKLDPRNLDFGQFREGFNLTNFNGEIVDGLKEYILRMVKTRGEDIMAAQMNISHWENVANQDIELEKITWNGEIHGRIRVVERRADHHYTPGQKAVLFGVIAVGALMAIPAVGIGIDKLGCRKTFTIVGLISATATALCPPAAALGFVPFLLIRLIQGVGFAACFPVIGAVTSAWARLTENGLFNGALTSFIQLAPVITMPLSGTICATIGWPFAYYAHSLITLTLMAFWWIIYRDTAGEHKRATVAELRLIQEGKVLDGRNKHKKFPFKAICTDVSVWAIWVAAFGNMYAIQMMIMFSPTYIREILHYAILNVGFAAAIPTLLQFVVKMIAGISSDKIRLDETKKVRLFNSIAFCGMATFMIALAFTPAHHYRLSLLFIILCVTVLGFNTGGFFKSATMIGRQYAYFIGAKIQVIMCVAMLTVPLFVYALTPNNTPEEWSHVFICHAILLLLTNAIFCLIGSGKAAPFTRIVDDQMMMPSAGNGQIKGEEEEEQRKPIIVEEARNNEPKRGGERTMNGNAPC